MQRRALEGPLRAQSTSTSATLNGELTDLETVDAAEVFFEYVPSGDGLDSSTARQTESETGPVSETVDGLDPETDYEFRAVAEAANVSDTGGLVIFTTDSDDSESQNVSPTIDDVSVRTRTTGPWSRAAAEWSVSDADGNLDSVTIELLNGGDVVDTETTSVSGSTASGEHQLRTRGDTDEVRLTVSDSDGATDSTTRNL